METVLITGATSGIGLFIASHLHEKGFKVFGISRTPEKYKNALPFELLELDITSELSIRDCIDSLISKTQTIDVLINNAGIGICGPAEETTTEQAYRQFETNFWGAVKMTRAVLPVMRQQKQGKIITIGSLAGLVGVPCQSYYSASKHALEGFYKSLKFEVTPFNIRISVIEPGFFKTNLHNAFEYATPAISAYDKMRKNALNALTASIEKAATPGAVARVILKIIHSANPGYSYRVGKNTLLAPFLQFLCYRIYEFGTRLKFGLGSRVIRPSAQSCP
jgi:NAD(P)-dependent dehydrogenase (short-subunit alcohol dehydrogenase family)